MQRNELKPSRRVGEMRLSCVVVEPTDVPLYLRRYAEEDAAWRRRVCAVRSVTRIGGFRLQ